MQILKTIHKVPGGLMVVPLFIGMLLNTFAPDAMKIGGFTQALTNVGYPTMLGVYLFTVGTKMTLNAAPQMLKRGFGIMFAKVGVAILVALGIAHFFDGDLLGLSTLAVLAAMNDTNGGMFMALTSTFGSKEDAGTYVPQSIETGPFLTMLVLVGAGLAVIPWLTMVSVIAPIAAGAVLGNLDKDIREFFEQHEPLVIPFMAFMLGQASTCSPSQRLACLALCWAYRCWSSLVLSAYWPTNSWAARASPVRLRPAPQAMQLEPRKLWLWPTPAF